MKKILILIIMITLPFLVGFGLGYSVGNRSIAQSSDESFNLDNQLVTTATYHQANRDSVGEQISFGRQNAITRAVGFASPAVVGINVTEVREYRYQNPWSRMFGDDPFFRQFFGDKTFKQEVKGLGSGFIVSPDGYILTNDHVAGNASKITITLTNKEKYEAELIGTDLVSDISLLKINGKDFSYLKLGNSDDVIIGEWVIAMGNPFGLFEISDKPTVTVGVVSATGMNLNAEGGRIYRGMIQTDAAINQGNSGGPLLNSTGEVIGVNAVIYTPNQGNIGLGFAIPINRVKDIVAELKRSGKIERNFWTGLEVQTVDARVARYFDLDKAEGVIVTDVKRRSPADESGFKPGDIIIEVNGEKIANENAIVSIVRTSRAGDVLKMKVIRDKKIFNLSLKLEKQPS
ncbi:MAG: trypsin-like peptidase domain-containing protein [Bacteroidota bacterium]|nr:trypsin-like peptidase domain-containing protein [Bacteroidota bacterium]